MNQSAAIPRYFLDGGASPPEEPLSLRAGPLAMQFEAGGLRYVRLGEREVVRRVYVAVRDENWGTVPDRITNLRTDLRDESFRVEFDVENQQGEINFAWHGTITGERTGRIVFEMNGVARSAFRKNRIGFCVLHPMECAGLPVEIRHADGSAERSAFPRYIAARNPFLDVVGLRHTVQAGVDAVLTFEGDVFETEDQRNWIDASFKTFCTPLSRPFPVEVQAGERIVQRVTMELVGDGVSPLLPLPLGEGRGEGESTRKSQHYPHPNFLPKGEATANREISLELSLAPIGPLPAIGFGFSPETDSLTPTEIQRLRILRPAHLRCELRLAGDFQTPLRQAAALINELGSGAQLELALFLDPQHEPQLAALLDLVQQLQPPIARWIIFPETGWSTTRVLAELAAKHLRKHDENIPIGGGTPANFRELNGNRPPIDALEFVAWSLTPQIHAFDNASLVETLAAHAMAVESAQQFAGKLPLVVGPVSLKMQVNPYATGAWPPPTSPGELPPQVDPRQMSLFGAGWTLGSLKYLAESQVQAVTYYEVSGWKGLMERESGPPLPERFPSLPGSVFPLYHVFADLAELGPAHVVPVRSSAPLAVEALALKAGTLTRLLVANLSPQPREVIVPVAGQCVSLRILDEGSLLWAVQRPESYRSAEPWIRTDFRGHFPLALPPYAAARVDAME